MCVCIVYVCVFGWVEKRERENIEVRVGDQETQLESDQLRCINTVPLC